VVAVVGALALAGCGEDTVDLRFRPAEGAELTYRTEVTSRTATDVSPCQPASERTEDAVLRSTHRVLEVDDDGARVEVALSRSGIGTRTVVVRFDRAAQLTEVEEVEGVPATALGELGLSEVFPAAAGAPPARRLRPGDRWAVDDEVTLTAGGEATRLRGSGRLVELGVEDGQDTATVETTTVLPVSTSATSEDGTRELDGEQVTELSATYDVDDGTLLRATSVTTGSFALELGPPPGGAGDPCVGTLDVEVRSVVTRRA
jgi:hypothetical protein